jgi:hypothetical protein
MRRISYGRDRLMMTGINSTEAQDICVLCNHDVSLTAFGWIHVTNPIVQVSAHQPQPRRFQAHKKLSNNALDIQKLFDSLTVIDPEM